MRPEPVFLSSTESRTVTDAQGVKVSVGLPFHGIVLTWGAWTADSYLENTHAPGTILDAGSGADRQRFSKSIMYWVYSEIEEDESIWARKLLPTGHGPFSELETLIAKSDGVFLGNGGHFGLVPTLRKLGLPALTLCWNDKTWDDCTYSTARVETALIGDPARGEMEITRYKEHFADLARDLQAATFGPLPSVLVMGTLTTDRSQLYLKNSRDYPYFAPAGAATPTDRYGRSRDAERVLMMDPDYIFLMGYGQKPSEFTHDPRWRCLKAVRAKQVYTMPGRDPGGGGLAGIVFQPLWTRWMGEIIHPDRLRPKLRNLLRETLLRDFNYQLSDVQIDELLRIKDNEGSEGYGRFMQDSQAGNGGHEP